MTAQLRSILRSEKSPLRLEEFDIRVGSGSRSQSVFSILGANNGSSDYLGVSRDRGGFSKASLRCPMVARRRNHLLQYPCQEKRRQAQLGSKLPRNLLDSDAPKACQPWPRFSAKGLFGTGTLDIGAMPPKIHMPSGNPKSPQIVG